MITQNNSLTWVEKYLHLPYRDHGNGDEGFDCWTLTRTVLVNEFGKRNVPLLDGYTRADDPGTYLVDNWDLWDSVKLYEELPGDVLAFSIRGNTAVHTGVVIVPGKALHIMRGRTSNVIEYYYQPYKNLIAKIGRWKD